MFFRAPIRKALWRLLSRLLSLYLKSKYSVTRVLRTS